MAFFLTPRFAPAYQAPQCNPFGMCASASRPSYTYRVARPRPQRPQYSSFNHFFNQVDELLAEIDQEAQRQAHVEAQREAHRQRQQQRKRALRAKFDVNQTEQGWQVDGEFNGFDQENINIEVTNEYTLKISGNTQWQAEKNEEQAQDHPVIDDGTKEKEEPTRDGAEDKMDGVTLNEPEFETVTEADTTTATVDSDTESHESYQATVEDDFEDLGAETSSLISSASRPSSPAGVSELKGKEKAVEQEPTPESQAVVPPQQESQQQPQEEERVHGSFERTFKFPERIDVTSVSASFKDGALKVTVPRAQAQKVRKIAIL